MTRNADWERIHIMKLVLVGIVIVSMTTAARNSCAADWNQWRGPLRNGVIAKSAPLLEEWPKEGLKKIWESEEKINGGPKIGYGSVVVADGSVFVFQPSRGSEPIKTRMLSANKIKRLGWRREAKILPPALLARIEQARGSDARKTLKDWKAITVWSKKWVDTQLNDDERKKFGSFATYRLNGGTKAIDLPVLEKLVLIKDKEFPSQQALDEWFTTNGIAGELRKRIYTAIPTTQLVGTDSFVCLDASTGKTIWKSSFPGAAHAHGSSSTPCVTDGRVYIIGSDGDAYCLDSATGKKLWHRKVATGAQSSSFLVLDGVAICPAGPPTGLNAQTGEVLWAHEKLSPLTTSPALWSNAEKMYVIIRSGKKNIICLEPQSGSILWNVATEGGRITIVGDDMAVAGRTGVAFYKLTPEKLEYRSKVKCPMDYALSATIIDQHAYVFGRRGTSCISMETGKLVWKNKSLEACSYNSPILGDNKILIQGRKGKGYGNGSLSMYAVSPEKGVLLANAPLKQVLCTTPALVDSRIFCRMKSRIVCYDLGKR